MKKPFVALTVVAIIVLALASVGPIVYKALTDPGIKTGGLHTGDASAATTDVNGTWTIIPNAGDNTTSVGYTFHELLPGESRSTSGTTHDVTGEVTVDGGTLTAGNITVDVNGLQTDVEKRDINVRRTILHTDDYPTATFTVSTPVDVTGVPDNGEPGTVTVTGMLNLHGVEKEVTAEFDVLRTGNRLVIAGTVPINRIDFGVETPDFVAAKVDEDGELNIRLAMEKH